VAMNVLGKFSELGFVCWATVVETVFMNISHGERIDVFKIEFVLCGELLAITRPRHAGDSVGGMLH
jgi:hypothetical protein